MQHEQLATAAVEVLAARLPALADDTVRPASDPGAADLYDLVRQWFSASGRTRAFEAFAVNPGDRALVHGLLREAVERDALFAAALAAAVGRAGATASQAHSSTLNLNAAGARGKIQAAGRDISDTRQRETSVDIGGMAAFAAVVVLLALVVLLVLRS